MENFWLPLVCVIVKLTIKAAGLNFHSVYIVKNDADDRLRDVYI